MKNSKTAYTFGCDCCASPLYFHEGETQASELLMLYPNKELALLAGSNIFPTSQPIIQVTVTVTSYGPKLQTIGGNAAA